MLFRDRPQTLGYSTALIKALFEFNRIVRREHYGR